MSFGKLRTIFLSVTLASSAVAMMACNGGGEPSDPHDKLAAVKDAISSPSGTVTAASMKNVSHMFTATEHASPVFQAIGAINSSAACQSGSQTSGSVDLSCATQGTVTGNISFEAEASVSASSTTATFVATFDNVCSGNVCATGSAIVEVNISNGDVETSIAFSADITEAGNKTHVFFGEETAIKNDTVTAKIALFDSLGDSYVINTSIGAGGVSYSINGGNGSFDCTIGDGTGQCSGSANFDF